MVVDPAAAAVARPAAVMVAVAVLELVQAAVEVTFAVDPSLYVAVAVNCCVAPAAMLGAAGVTAMEESDFTAAITVNVAVPLMPLTVAVTVLEPAATAVASPAALTVAIVVVELVHAAVEVTFAVDPSL
jgi:hypothetical protein